HRDRVPHVVRRPSARRGPMGLPQLRGVRAALRGADERVPLPAHRGLSAREPARGRTDAAARVRRSRRGVTRRLPLVALAAAAWAVAAWYLWNTSVVPSSLRLPHVERSPQGAK